MNALSKHRLAPARGTRARFRLPLPLALLAVCTCQPEPARSPVQVEPTPFYRFEGVVRLKNGSALDYAAILAPDPATPGGYLGTSDVPRQALSGADLRVLRYIPGQRVEFELPIERGPHWIADFNADGTLECGFSQGDTDLPCTMQRVVERPTPVPAPRHRRQTPLPPLPYTALPVKYANTSAHSMLAGTLTLPTSAGAHPGALLLGGRGQDREGMRFGHEPLAVLADTLTRAGIAVLRASDRAAERLDLEAPDDLESQDASFAQRVGDAIAGLAYLRSHSDIDAARVGVVSYGSGSEVAERTAGATSAAFLVLLAPGALPPLAPAEATSPLARVRCPVLALSGEHDREVDAAHNSALLRAALHNTANIEILPGLNHFLQPSETGDPAEYEAIEDTFAAPVLERISSWLRSTLDSPLGRSTPSASSRSAHPTGVSAQEARHQ